MNKKVFPGPLGRENSPQLVSAGKPAAETVAHFLPTAQAALLPSSYGLVELSPGTIWKDHLLVFASPQEVFFTSEDSLYVLPTEQFIEQNWPTPSNRLVSQISKIQLAQEEKEILQSIFVPWYVTLQMSAARTGSFYFANRDTLEQTLQMAPALLQILNACRYRYHKLFMPIPSSTEAGFAINGLPVKCSKEDVAYFIARLLKDPKKEPRKTLGAVQNIVANTIAIVLKTVDALEKLFYMVVAYNTTKIILMFVFPPAGKLMPWVEYDDVKETAIAEYADYLAARMGEEGYFLSKSEAIDILKDLVDDPGTILRFRDLEALLIRFIPVINRLYIALYQSC
jgi:hypothetical protein